MFVVPYILVTCFNSNPTGCTIFFFLEKFFALHDLDVTESESDRAEVTNCPNTGTGSME
jgi:hypothetical protein